MRRALLATAVGLLALALLSPAAAAAASGQVVRGAQSLPRSAGCAVSRPGHAHCYLSTRPAGAKAAIRAGTGCPASASAGYTPCNLWSAYGLKTFRKIDGVGQTVAVVDAYDDPNAAADLSVYRKAYGLGKCTTGNGCFRKVNQNGVAGDYPSPDAGWASEISLDIEMVSAICPKCHILLVEASSSGNGDLYSAVAEAAALGATVISDSWGSGEYDGETGWDGDFDLPGIPITFSSGDGAYQAGVQYPSASQYVVSVGGTELTPAANKRKWTETAWVNTSSNPPTQGSGSGCSQYEPKPSWQTDSGCSMRTTADVSAVAADVLNYNTYDASGWYFNFGTSVSSPIIAGVYALAGNGSSVTSPASLPYANPGSLYDITSGSEGTCSPSYLCNAGPGYDGPTGVGTPHGVAGF